MKRLATIAALLSPMPLAAQSAAPPVAPPVLTLDPLASLVVARGMVESPKGTVPVQLLVAGDDAVVRGMLPGETGWRYLRIADDPDAVLRLLADRRVGFLWAPLLKWAGPDLGLLRQRMVDRAERAYTLVSPREAQNSADSTVRPPTRALLQFVNILFRAGYADRARALLEADRARRTLKSEWDQVEWVIVTTREANQLIGSGRYDEAIALLRDSRARIGSDNIYGLNLDINRAAALANIGRSAEALALIDAARAKFDRPIGRKRDAERVDGSDRQFDWIKGCALDRLGRHDEARPILARVLGADEPADPFFKPESNDSLRFRIYTCKRDVRALSDAIAETIDSAPLAPGAFVVGQPAWRTPNDPGGTFAAAVADPALRLSAGRWMRDLPPALTPALNYWR